MKKGPTVERRPLQWHEAELCQADAFQVAHQVDYKTHPHCYEEANYAGQIHHLYHSLNIHLIP